MTVPSLRTVTLVPHAFRTARVVVVDDVLDNVVLLEHLLRRAGVAQVDSFTDSEEALRRIPELDPDLLLLDLHMPQVDGFAVIERLRATLPSDTFLPVLVLTADASRETRRRALDLGAKDFLTKPIDTDEALLRVRNLLETRALHTQLRRHNLALQEQLDEATARERRLAEATRDALASVDRLLAVGPRMLFQPIYDLVARRLVGVEALARFDGTDPERAFALAEQVGRGVELEMAAIRAATTQLGGLPPGVFLSVNASVATACSPDLAAHLRTVPCDALVLELTEHTHVDDYPGLVAAIAGHRAAGLRLAIDDTGAGYASFHHLLHLRPEVIKLDIGLTRSIDTDPARRALAVALRSFADEVGATVIAEGVETASELRVLKELQVPWGQGFHLARPGPLPAA